MYSKFKLNQSVFDNITFNQLDLISGKSLGTKFRNKLNESLEIKFKDNKEIDGTAIQEEWFSNIDCDIFLSHSHKDIDRANGFAGWVKKQFDLNVFIDYNVWGNMNDLLRTIDNQYCYKPKTKTYSYEKRNVTTSHVHMMLINALMDLMDRTECIMFFESPNSINMSRLKHESVTQSPWIYNEIFLSKVLRKKSKPRKIGQLQKATESVRLYSTMNESFEPNYNADTNHLVNMQNKDLNHWEAIYKMNPNSHPLDILYALKKIEQ
jgi:hypothetical protein